MLIFQNLTMISQMEISDNQHKIILLDCDVLSHFIINESLNDLPLILAPHRCVILDYVCSEVARLPKRFAFLKDLLVQGSIKVIDFPDDLAINKEFARIKSQNPLIGDGERACMAFAKFKESVVASSNFRDIVPYCKQNKIYYLGTLDILSVAVTKEIYDEEKCDIFIQTALKYNKAYFPKGVTSMRYYITRDLSFL